jgi:hypothetical protein
MSRQDFSQADGTYSGERQSCGQIHDCLAQSRQMINHVSRRASISPL